MRFNKNPFEYLVNHKVLHKIGKQWVTISIGALMLFSGTSFATHVNADQVQNNPQITTNEVINNKNNQADANNSTSTNQSTNSSADTKANNSEVSQQNDQALAQSATSSVNNVNVKPQQNTLNTNSDNSTKATNLDSDNSASSNQQQSTNHLPVPNTLTNQAKALHTKLLNNALADALQDNKDANKPVAKSTETSSKHSNTKALKKGHKTSKYSKFGKANKTKYHHHYKYNKKYRKYHTLKNHKKARKYNKHSKYAYKNKKKYTKYGKKYGRKATKAHKKYSHKYYLKHKKNKKRAVKATKKVIHRKHTRATNKHKKHIYHYRKHASVQYKRKSHEKYVQGAMLLSDSNEANHSNNKRVSSQAHVVHSPNSDANVEWLNTDDEDHQYAIPDEDLNYFQNDNSDSYADHLVDLGRITPSKVRVKNQTNVNCTNFDNIYYPEADSNYWVTANSVSHNKNNIYNLSDFANFLSSEENKFLNNHFNSADIAQIQNVRNRYNYLMTNENQSDGDTNPADFRQHMVDWINFYRTYVYKESPVNEDASFDATAQHSANIQSDPEDMDWGDVKPSEILRDYITDAADIDNDGETDHRDSVLRTSNGLVGVGQSGKVNALFFNFGMGNGSVNDPQNIDYPKVSDFPLSLAQKGEFWSVQSPALSGSVSVDVEDLTEHQSLPVSHITVGSNEVYFKVDPSYLYTGHDYRIYVNCPNFNSPYWYDTSFYNL